PEPSVRACQNRTGALPTCVPWLWKRPSIVSRQCAGSVVQLAKPGCCADGGTFVLVAMSFDARKVGQPRAVPTHLVTRLKLSPSATAASAVYGPWSRTMGGVIVPTFNGPLLKRQ